MSEFFEGVFGQPPGFLIEAIQQRQAEHLMHLRDNANRIEGLFDELNLDQLAALRSMLNEISQAGEKAETMADYYIGWAAALLKFKFGVCSHCGADHETEALANLTDQQPEDTEKESDVEETEIDMPEEPLDKFREITPEERELMNQYHLDDLRIEGTNELIGFVCTGIEGGPTEGCGMRYPSIEDRMLKGPEECSGCFVRAGQG